VIIPAHTGVHKLDNYFLAYAFEVAVAPVFEGERRSLTTAFFYGTVIAAAARMGLNLVRRTELDIHLAAVALPPWDARGEVFVGIFDAAVMLFLEFVFFGIGSGIAALPEGFDELVTLLVVGELFERLPLFVRDDVNDVLVEPFLVGLAEFLI
jgi:hypothetical protein